MSNLKTVVRNMTDTRLRELILELLEIREGTDHGTVSWDFITQEICVAHDEWFRREQDQTSNLVMN